MQIADNIFIYLALISITLKNKIVTNWMKPFSTRNHRKCQNFNILLIHYHGIVINTDHEFTIVTRYCCINSCLMNWPLFNPGHRRTSTAVMKSHRKVKHSAAIAMLNHHLQQDIREWLISLQTRVIISISQADADSTVSSLMAFCHHTIQSSWHE